MSLELIREELKVNSVIVDNSAQTIVQSDIIVPDVKPDIARILLIDGDSRIKDADAAQDRILVNGSISYKILYTSDDDARSVKSINNTYDFTCSIDSPGAKPGHRCDAACDIEHIEFELLNGRKLSVKTIVSVKGKAFEESTLDIAKDFSGVEDVQILRSGMYINSFAGEAQDEYTVAEKLEIPAGKPSIAELLRSDVKITGMEYSITNGKVIVEGELNISTLYTADDETRSIQFMEHEIPFSRVLDIPDIDSDNTCDVDVRINAQQFDASEDSDGEQRILLAEIPLYVHVSATSKKNIDIIEDAYSPSFKLSLERRNIDVEDVVVQTKSQISLKDTVILDNSCPGIRELFNVLSKPVLTECTVYGDSISVEGLIANNILYLSSSEEEPLFCYSQEIPFKHSIEMKGAKPGMQPVVALNVEHCSYSMSTPNEVDLRAVVDISAKLTDKVSIPLITRAIDYPLDNERSASQPSITIYFAQPGDNLWKIAKKYATTVDGILSMNDLDDEADIRPGQQVFISKKA